MTNKTTKGNVNAGRITAEANLLLEAFLSDHPLRTRKDTL